MAEASDAKKPKSFFGRVGTGLALALTGIGTGVAGLSTGQMESAMYWRSLAAQDQARATSQWTLAGFKKTRAVAVGSGARTLRAVGGRGSLTTPEKFRAAVVAVLAGLPPAVAAKFRTDLDEALASPGMLQLFRMMAGEVPAATLPELPDAQLRAILDAIRAKQTAGEIRARAVPVERTVADDAIRQAELYAEKYDRDLEPVIEAQHRLDKFVTELEAAAADTVADPNAPPPHARAAAGILASTHAGSDALDERIYNQETRISQETGNLYEVRVVISDVKADRYRVKSLYLFYALILLQTAAGIAAIGSDRSAALVLLALVIGLAGVAFAGYAYLTPDPTIPGLS